MPDNLMRATQAFRDFLALNSHHYDGELILNSPRTFERFACPLGSLKNKHCAYFLRTDSNGNAYGFFQCHGGMCGIKQSWKEQKQESDFKRLTPEERQTLLREQYESQCELAGDRIRSELEGAKFAKALMNQALIKGINKTPYVINKKLFALEGLKKWSEILYVPLRDVQGNLFNIERIYSTHEKRPLPGARVNGLFHLFGKIDPTGDFQLTEGVATASIAFEANGTPTGCCRNADNLINVARELKRYYPKITLQVCGDDDRFKLEQAKIKALRLGKPAPQKNAGVQGALTVANELGASVSFPDFSILGTHEYFLSQEKPPSDWHDLFLGLINQGLNRAAALAKVQQQIHQHSKG